MTNLGSAILDPLLARNPAGPRITYYDDATGERIECSTVTLANWAAKTANLLLDEMECHPSSHVAVMLPAHWQTAAVMLGIWWAGAEVVLEPPRPDSVEQVLCTADRIDEADLAVGGGSVAVLSLDPFGTPASNLPVGVIDYATAVRVHGDQITPWRQTELALDGRMADDVLAAARASAAKQCLTADDRVLSSAPWDTADDVIEHLLAPYVAGASLVYVANANPYLLDRRRETEKTTRG
jgi:uncharacterized protein (TIGR03089 family)